MGVFSRLAQLIKANLNDLISRSEDPEKMLNQVVVEKTNAAEWERRAVLAVRSGDDNLAKEALSRKREHDALAKTFEEQWQKQKASVDQLKQALRLLNDKIEEAKRKKNVLIARKKRAEAQKAIHETMNGLKDQSAFETFSRLEQKIDRIEAEAEAGAELADDYSGDSLAHKFKKLEISSGADDELAALKEKMGLVEPAPPAPTQVRVEPVATPEPPRAVEDVPRPQHALDQSEQDELAAALAEIEAEEARERDRMKR
jgi:phage shock protein A